MTDPVSRTLLLLDIERYSDRDDVEQAYLRRMLYDITDRTLDNAGIHERLRLRADRGEPDEADRLVRRAALPRAKRSQSSPPCRRRRAGARS